MHERAVGSVSRIPRRSLGERRDERELFLVDADTKTWPLARPNLAVLTSTGNGPGGHPRVRVIYWPPAGPVQRLEILPLELP